MVVVYITHLIAQLRGTYSGPHDGGNIEVNVLDWLSGGASAYNRDRKTRKRIGCGAMILISRAKIARFNLTRWTSKVSVRIKTNDNRSILQVCCYLSSMLDWLCNQQVASMGDSGVGVDRMMWRNA